jgi:sortase A
MKRGAFVWKNPAAYVVVPLVFAALIAGVLLGAFKWAVAPYEALISLFLDHASTEQATDLLQAVQDANATAQAQETQAESIPLSSIEYPTTGDRYANITISGTTVDAPVYYGDASAQLNKGVGTYKDDYRVGIPGEGKTILLAAHNNTFFNDLQHVEIGSIVTIETHYGTYTYEVTDMQVKNYQDETAYDFTRTDENLILYTCYPFDALGFTPNRYFVYAKYCSGPVLDATQ